jgi:hypothetical protein
MNNARKIAFQSIQHAIDIGIPDLVNYRFISRVDTGEDQAIFTFAVNGHIFKAPWKDDLIVLFPQQSNTLDPIDMDYLQQVLSFDTTKYLGRDPY